MERTILAVTHLGQMAFVTLAYAGGAKPVLHKNSGLPITREQREFYVAACFPVKQAPFHLGQITHARPARSP